MTTGTDRLAAAERAEQALSEYLRPAFQTVEAAYVDKLTNLAAETPWETDKITKLAMALKIMRTAQAQIEALATGGAAIEAQMDYARQIEKIPAHKRSILGL